ncbi:DUF4139 domain-containing protein [bacterium]|nr:DUF4139 domain-containing protein [bacterium]
MVKERMRWATSGLLLVLVLTVALSTTSATADEGVAITAYNSDLALVKDVRVIDLARGVQEVRFPDVAQRIDPTSVHFRVLDGGDAFVWEQNYRFDLASTSKILEKYLEREIDVVTEDADLFSGTLVSFDGSTVVLDQGRGSGPIVTLNADKISYVRFPSLPKGLISKPSLVWKIGAEKDGSRLVEVTYLTSSINWHAEYVGVINAEDDVVDLAAWVSVDNRSGATYTDAKLDLVAGDVNRAVVPPSPVMMAREAKADVQGLGMPEFAEEELFEYHLYKLDTPSTLADREIKQLTFFPSTSVAVEKVMEFDHYYGTDVRVLLEFANSEEDGLGVPLPAGKVRMYKEDSAGDLQFIGEDRIDHTAKDEDVALLMGNAFDVKAERITADRRRITDRVHEEDYEVSVRNHKDEDIVVRVVEHPRGYWTIKGETHPYEKKDASRVEFLIPVKADGETVLSYTVRYEY